MNWRALFTALERNTTRNFAGKKGKENCLHVTPRTYSSGNDLRSGIVRSTSGSFDRYVNIESGRNTTVLLTIVNQPAEFAYVVLSCLARDYVVYVAFARDTDIKRVIAIYSRIYRETMSSWTPRTLARSRSEYSFELRKGRLEGFHERIQRWQSPMTVLMSGSRLRFQKTRRKGRGRRKKKANGREKRDEGEQGG